MRLPFHTVANLNRFINGNIESYELTIPTEYIFTVIMDTYPLFTFASSGNEIEVMVTGMIHTRGILKAVKEIRNIEIDYDKKIVTIIPYKKVKPAGKETGNSYITSSSGGIVPILPDHNAKRELPFINAQMICECSETFSRYSREHTLTHGVHSSAIYGPEGSQLVFFDDIGRHNAIDKSIGYALQNGISLKDNILFTTGRISGEIISKVIFAEGRTLCSLATVTSYAIELAKKHNILACCKVKKDSLIIINGRESILQ